MFSVIITTHNRDKLLKKAYKSVIKQSYKPNEIIIINNGSSKYFKKNFLIRKKVNLKIINNHKNLFQSRARNLGAKISKNKYICFLDDDDIWEKNYLNHARKLIISSKNEIILSKIYTYKNKLKLFKDPKNFKLSDILIKNPGITGSNVIFNKKIFMSLGGYNSKLEPSEDKSILVEAILKNRKIGFSDKKIIFSLHQGKRLTKNYHKLSNGVYNFFEKYKKYMNFSQKVFVLNRINIYRLKSFQLKFISNFIFFYLLNKIVN